MYMQGQTTTPADNLVRSLLAAGTPAQHRDNLHHMLIGWLTSHHHDLFEEKIDLVYNTYQHFLWFLDELEQRQADRERRPDIPEQFRRSHPVTFSAAYHTPNGVPQGAVSTP